MLSFGQSFHLHHSDFLFISDCMRAILPQIKHCLFKTENTIFLTFTFTHWAWMVTEVLLNFKFKVLCLILRKLDNPDCELWIPMFQVPLLCLTWCLPPVTTNHIIQDTLNIYDIWTNMTYMTTNQPTHIAHMNNANFKMRYVVSRALIIVTDSPTHMSKLAFIHFSCLTFLSPSILFSIQSESFVSLVWSVWSPWSVKTQIAKYIWQDENE